MSSASLRFVKWAAALSVAAGQLGCRNDTMKKQEPGVLDAMQLAAARRVGLESAADAMQRRDLDRLKSLSTWVRKRAQVVLFDADDLKSLDLAISCLDGSLARTERAAALDPIKSGKLLEPVRDLCLDESD